jgi:carboxypeptidase A
MFFFLFLTSQFSLSWFDDERPPQKSKAGFGFDRYNSYDEIMTFLDETQARFPQVTTLISIGNSFEGKEIMGIEITKNNSNKILFIDANIHAREWIASASAVWVINEILTNNDPTIRAILDELTIYVFPMLNPDGYIYSYNVNRLWRKTRSTHSSMLCVGGFE